MGRFAWRPRGTAILRAYPRTWRARYESEVAAILEDRPPDFQATIDLARGALDAHLHPPAPSPPWPALFAGVAWTIVGVGTLAEATPLDWPGYSQWSLLVAAIAAGASLLAVLAIARRFGDDGGRPGSAVLWLAVLGQFVLAIALVVATLGGPYGAVTGAAGTVAAIGLVAVGLGLERRGDHVVGVGILGAGALLLVPWPGAWLVAGAMWTSVGVWLYFEPRAADRGAMA